MSWTTAILLITITVAIIVAWLFSEFKTEKKWIRCLLGILALTFCIGLTVLIFRDLLNLSSSLAKFSYNEFHGETSERLIDTTIEQLEAGKKQEVLNSLKKLQDKFQPTYENRANYDKLVSDAINDMKKQ